MIGKNKEHDGFNFTNTLHDRLADIVAKTPLDTLESPLHHADRKAFVDEQVKTTAGRLMYQPIAGLLAN